MFLHCKNKFCVLFSEILPYIIIFYSFLLTFEHFVWLYLFEIFVSSLLFYLIIIFRRLPSAPFRFTEIKTKKNKMSIPEFQLTLSLMLVYLPFYKLYDLLCSIVWENLEVISLVYNLKIKVAKWLPFSQRSLTLPLKPFQLDYL